MAKGRKGMMPGGGNMNNMMKQVQKMQSEMMKAQQEAELKEYETTAGGGAIKVKVNGKKELLSIELDEDIVDPEDVEMLQDLIVAAVNEALRTADAEMGKVMNKYTGGLNLF